MTCWLVDSLCEIPLGVNFVWHKRNPYRDFVLTVLCHCKFWVQILDHWRTLWGDNNLGVMAKSRKRCISDNKNFFFPDGIHLVQWCKKCINKKGDYVFAVKYTQGSLCMRQKFYQKVFSLVTIFTKITIFALKFSCI